MDHDRFPTAAAYVARLPDGLASHPECVVKASVLRDVVDARPLDRDDLDALPPEVAPLISEPPPVSAWVPEVHALVAMIAVRDRHFAPGEVGLAAYEAWTYERNRKLLARPLYRALFLVLTPERLLARVETRWAMFRRGSTLELVGSAPGRAELRMSYPSHLVEHTTARGLRGALRAATELAGGRDVAVEIVSIEEREAHFVARFR